MRYRVTITEIIDGQPATVMDAWGSGFHATVGDINTLDTSKPNTAKAAHST